MKSTATKSNVEAPHHSNTETSSPATPKHLSDPMKVTGLIEGWFATRLATKLSVKVGKIAVFRGASGQWGPYLKTGQVIECMNGPLRKITARVERFLEDAPRKTSRYYRGPVKPLPSSYVVVVMKIEDVTR